MSRKLTLALLMLALTGTAALAGAQSLWFHIRVDEKGTDGEIVRVNVPVKLVEAVLPMIEEKEFHHGTVRLDHHDVDAAQLRQMLAAVRDSEDGEYVTVDGPDEKVRIRKENGVLSIDVDEGGATPETVHVRVRMEVLDAMLSGQSDELDIAAGVQKLGEMGHGDIVTVHSDDETVRIWVDDKNTDE